MIRYGCFVPQTNTKAGDQNLASEAEAIWRQKLFLDDPVPDPGDGVFCSMQKDGTIRRRLVYRGVVRDVCPPKPLRLPDREAVRAALLLVEVKEAV